MRRGGKYGVAPVEDRTLDGVVFDSKREMQEWAKFQMLERSGIIHNLERQVRFPLNAVDPKGNPFIVGHYVADIVCQDRDGRTAIYDVKGVRTATYKWKRKHFEGQYGLRIVEI